MRAAELHRTLIDMGKLILKPKLNANFARAIYLGVLYAIFRYCTDILAVRYFGANPSTMVALASIMGLLMFAYLVYLNLELQDVIDKHHSSNGRDGTTDDSEDRA